MSKIAELSRKFADSIVWNETDVFSEEEMDDFAFNYYFKGMEDMKELIIKELEDFGFDKNGNRYESEYFDGVYKAIELIKNIK